MYELRVAEASGKDLVILSRHVVTIWGKAVRCQSLQGPRVCPA
jgi:hypothetical protein